MQDAPLGRGGRPQGGGRLKGVPVADTVVVTGVPVADAEAGHAAAHDHSTATGALNAVDGTVSSQAGPQPRTTVANATGVHDTLETGGGLAAAAEGAVEAGGASKTSASPPNDGFMSSSSAPAVSATSMKIVPARGLLVSGVAPVSYICEDPAPTILRELLISNPFAIVWYFNFHVAFFVSTHRLVRARFPLAASDAKDSMC